jgi:ferredoxin
MIRIIHLREKCIGCNACVELAPDRWKMSRKDGKSVLVDGEEKNGIFTTLVGDDELKKTLLAAKMCPTNIIKVEKVHKKS